MLGYRTLAAGAGVGMVASIVWGLLLPWPEPRDTLVGAAIGVPIFATLVFLWVRRPEHPIARRLLVFVALQVGFLLSVRLAVSTPESAFFMPVHTLAVALAGLLGALVVSIVLLLPDGTYARGWHRRLARAILVVAPLAGVLDAVVSPRIELTSAVAKTVGDTVESSLYVPALASFAAVVSLLEAAVGASSLLAVILLLIRYRNAAEEQRLQLQLIVLALAATAVLAVTLRLALDPSTPAARSYVSGLGSAAGGLLIFGSIAVSVLRYRLLDIHVVIRRSIVYGAIWAFTGALFFAVATGLGLAASARLPAAGVVALSVAATLGFQPLRLRLNDLASRRVFGPRLTRYELLARFGETLEHAYDLDRLAPEIASAVRVGVDVEWARVLLSDGGATYSVMHPVAADGIDLESEVESALHVPMVHGGEVLGSIECGPRREGSFSEADHELLSTLSRQAALAMRNGRLASELSRHIDQIERQAKELAASRARLVAAQDAERRRIERDIHDGVQQDIASLLAKLRLARNQLSRDAGVADSTLAEVQTEARGALDDLRTLAHGIHPPILTDRGLLEAVEARVARLPIGVRIEADGLLRGERFPEDVEAAGYFFVSEALTNVVKHADAPVTTVRLTRLGEGLDIAVEDNGRGFVPADAVGSGLTGLRDRIEAVGGTLQITSAPACGTRVLARLPLPDRTELRG